MPACRLTSILRRPFRAPTGPTRPGEVLADAGLHEGRGEDAVLRVRSQGGDLRTLCLESIRALHKFQSGQDMPLKFTVHMNFVI